MTMTRKMVAAVVAAVAALALRAEYTDGLLWSFSAKQGELDGTFDATKFVDAVTEGAATPFTLTFNYDDIAARPYFTNMTVRSGLQGKSFQQTCLYMPQPTNGTPGVDFVTKCACATVPHAKLAQTNVTFFIRYSWDGKYYNQKDFGGQYAYNYTITIYDNARDYGSSKGWTFYFSGVDSYTTTHPYVLRSLWVPYTANDCWLGWNQAAGSDWIDLAVTLRNTDEGETEFKYYVCRAGETSITTYSHITSGKGGIPLPGSGDGKLFGAHGTTLAGGTTPDAFRGAISKVALWDRALSAEEINFVFRDAGMPLILNNENLVLNEDRRVSYVIINGDCTINGPGKLILSTPQGVTVSNGTATLSCPVEFDSGAEAVRMTVDATSKLVQTGVWSGATPIKLIGPGSDYATHWFELRGTNTFTGNLIFDRAKVYLYGGASVGTADGSTSWTVSKGYNGSLVYFMGGIFAENFSAAHNNNYTGWWQSTRFAEDTTNIFTGALNLGNAYYYVAEAGSRTFFDGTVAYNDYTPSVNAGAEITFTTNCSYQGSSFYPGGGGITHIYSQRKGGYGTTFEYRVQSGMTWKMYGTNLINGTVGRGGEIHGTLDLNGFDQFMGACRSAQATGVVTSGTPATIIFDQSNYADVVNANVFAGAVNLKKQGANNFGLSGASTSTGTLQIAEGTVTMAPTGSWAGLIDVADGTTLAFASGRTLTAGTMIAVADGGTIALDAQLVADAGQISVDGQPLAVGKYTSANGFISGDGSIIVSAAMGDPIVVEADMTIDEDVLVPSVTFKGQYRISGTGSISVRGGGIVIDDGAENKKGYAIDVPLMLDGNIAGSGYLTLMKGGSFLSATEITNVNLIVSGTLDAANGMTFVQTPPANDRAELILSNAVINAGTAQITLATEDRYYALRSLANTTNAVNCGLLHGSSSNGRFLTENGAKTDFNCPVNNLSYFCPSGGGEMWFNGKVSAWKLSASEGAIHLAAAGNVFSFDGTAVPQYATAVAIGKNHTLFCNIAGALNDRRTAIQPNGTLVLTGDQFVGATIGSGTVTSPTGATYDFEQRMFTSSGEIQVTGPTTNTIVFADSVNVTKRGTLMVYFGGVSTSTGELQVVEGAVGFSDAGCWRTCPTVRVGANGRLVLGGMRRFDWTTDLYLETGAKLEIPGGTGVNFANLYIDGVKQPPGYYKKTNLPAFIEGDGTLCTTGEGFGTVLRLR
ncbi:MAG TPA: hypothetical protein PLZ74_04690 [Kiritimatiellia bacterium]|nr:hypothetical protein [Kiritimatiellia bacterium]